jgi:hypothetical protein
MELCTRSCCALLGQTMVFYKYTLGLIGARARPPAFWLFLDECNDDGQHRQPGWKQGERGNGQQ